MRHLHTTLESEQMRYDNMEDPRTSGLDGEFECTNCGVDFDRYEGFEDEDGKHGLCEDCAKTEALDLEEMEGRD